MHAKDGVHHFVPAYEMALLIVINRLNVIDLLEGQQKASMGDGHGSSNPNRGCTYINFAFARSWKDLGRPTVIYCQEGIKDWRRQVRQLGTCHMPNQ